MALEKSMENAESYIRHCKRAVDVSEIAWRFLLGNRILEYLDEMEIVPEKGTDFKVIAANLDSYTVKLGNTIIHMEASKPNGSIESTVMQPNLK